MKLTPYAKKVLGIAMIALAFVDYHTFGCCCAWCALGIYVVTDAQEHS